LPQTPRPSSPSAFPNFAPRKQTPNRFEIALGNPQKIRQLEEALRTASAAHKTAERELAHERAKSGDLAAQFEELSQAFGALKEDLGRVETDASQCAAEVARLKALLKKTEEKFVREQEAKAALVQEAAQGAALLADVRRQLEAAQSQLTDQLTYRETSVNELKRIHAIATELEKEKAARNEELERRFNRIQELEVELEALRNPPSSPPRHDYADDDNGPPMMAEESDDGPPPPPPPHNVEEASDPEDDAQEAGECMWWTKYRDRPKAKPCYGEIATLGHHYHGELKLCARHVCTQRGPGCRLIARPVGHKCGACSRTDEGKERLKDYDYDRSRKRRRPRGGDHA
jgi:hypothetical protein